MRVAPNYTAVIQCGKSGGKCDASIVFLWNELGLELNSVARSPARASARRRAAGRPPQGGKSRPPQNSERGSGARRTRWNGENCGGGGISTAAFREFGRGVCPPRAGPTRPARACLRAAHMPARSILSVVYSLLLGRRAG